MTTTDRYAVLNLVDDFVPLPTLRLQQEGAELMKKTGHAVVCSATVLQGESLWVRAARPLVGVIAKLARTSYPMAAFATIDEAAAWIPKHLPMGSNAPAVLAGAIRSSLTPEVQTASVAAGQPG